MSSQFFVNPAVVIRWSSSARPTIQTQSGVINVSQARTRTITGGIRIIHVSTQTQSGVVHIKATAVKEQAGVLNVQNTTAQVQSGVINIVLPIKTISGTVNIARTAEKTQSGVVNISTPDVLQTISGVVRVVSVPSAGRFVNLVNFPAVIIRHHNLKMFTVQNQSGVINIIADTTPPTTPGSLSGSLTHIGDGAVLTWTASTDDVAVTGYIIQRCSGISCSGFSTLTTVSGSTLTYTDFTSPGNYCYRIQATDAAGNLSGYSNTFCTSLIGTTLQTQSGVIAISAPTIQVQTAVINIIAGTSSLGVKLSQNVLEVVEKRSNNIRNSQTLGQVIEKRANNLKLSQVVLLVIRPRVGSNNYAFSGDGSDHH